MMYTVNDQQYRAIPTSQSKNRDNYVEFKVLKHETVIAVFELDLRDDSLQIDYLNPSSVPIQTEILSRSEYTETAKLVAYIVNNHPLYSPPANYLDENRILSSPATSNWLKQAITDTNSRDLLDATRDAELLAQLLKHKLNRVLNSISADISASQSA